MFIVGGPVLSREKACYSSSRCLQFEADQIQSTFFSMPFIVGGPVYLERRHGNPIPDVSSLRLARSSPHFSAIRS
jgi:hypothetical protein